MLLSVSIAISIKFLSLRSQLKLAWDQEGSTLQRQVRSSEISRAIILSCACTLTVYIYLRVSLGIPCAAGVQVDGEVLPADAVVIALGPWTNTLASSLQLPHISGQLGHSIVLKPSSSSSSDPIPADCLFLSWQNKSGDADTDSPNLFE